MTKWEAAATPEELARYAELPLVAVAADVFKERRKIRQRALQRVRSAERKAK